MIITQWIVWIISLLIFIYFLYGIRNDAKTDKPIHIVTLVQVILLLFSPVIFLFHDWSKFHLLWVVPTCFILGWIIGFIILPVPVIGDILRNISLIFAYIFLSGTDWEIGGFPWEVSTLRALRARIPREQYSSIDDFEAAIKQHEDQLFGISLYNEGIKYLYSHDKDMLDDSAYHFRRIIERGEKAISEAKSLLEKVKNGTEHIEAIKKFEFPPTHGPGLDEMTERANLIAEVYEKIFPNRARSIPLTTKENEKLMKEVGKIL